VSDTTAITDPRVDTVLQGRYRIIARIAAGGMGVVYRGQRLELERPVAIKFLHPWIAADQDFKRRFEIEIKAMSRLAHPCCVSFIDYGEDQGSPYLVMDLLTGDTLRMSSREGPLEPARAVRIARQILAGLAHAHDQGIIHRDIKPDNIVLAAMVGVDEQVRILDFGVAKLNDAAGGTLGAPIGTPAYMAPEQIQGQSVDARTDVYATGLVLFELLTGRRPFECQDSAEIYRQQIETPPPAMRTVLANGTLSPQLEAAVARALEKLPRKRFASAREFADALTLTPEGQGHSAPVSKSTPRTPARAVPAIIRSATERLARLASRRGALRGFLRARWRWAAVVLGVSAAAATALFVSRQLPWPAPADSSAAAPPLLADVEPEQIAGVDDAYRVGIAGRPDSALSALGRLRAANPASAYIPFIEGRVQFANYRWPDGLASFRQAIEKDPRYRADGRLILDVIRCLDSDRSHYRCEQFLVEEIGPGAVSYLEDASRAHPLLNVQLRAARLVNRLRGSSAAAD
jgi:hypothetical protein